MKPFRNYPIQQKLLVMVLLICGAVLFVAIAALFTFQVLNFRSDFQRDTATLAAITANNSTMPLAFKNAKAVTEVVASLKAKPTVVAACLVLPDGSLFAQFGKAEYAQTLSQFPPAGEFRFIGGHLLYTQSVELDRKPVGTLYLRTNCRQTFLELLRYCSLVIGVVLATSCLLAVFLSARLGRVITRPLLELTETARIIAEKQDYSVRAATASQTDELGRLTGAFNQMLVKIESADAALRQANQTREHEIAKHTSTEQALQTSERFLRSLVESLPQNILRKDLAGRFTFANGVVCRTLGKSMDQIIGKTDSDLFPPELAAKYRSDDEKVISSGKTFETVEENQNSAGEKIFVQVIKTPLCDVENRPVGLQVIFWDVTARKRSEEALETLHKELLLASRHAGMAEVATGVLHNVGNVLNSVSVSATLVSDRLRRSKVTNLHRATAMLREQNGRLVEFLTSDPKGKLLPDYLATLADQLAGEQTELLEEMTSVGQHIEHIKEIVAMQQSYAKVSGAYETLPAVGLVEDAIRMNTAAFERHRVQVVREFDGNTPPVCVDRHKVLQILINLLRNAKYAMDQQNAHDKRLVIRVGLAAADRVKITVCDNGAGIAPENLIKIFNHGFTTKKDGHGFGLHSGANAAKEMGGRLTVHSDGLGQGAEFALELPVAATAQKEENTANQGKT